MLRITSGAEWNFDAVEEIYGTLERIATEKYSLNCFPNQLEVITSEQMLDAYASNGLPVYYPHWSHGEQFVRELEAYKRGYMGLAYEIVINSNPCIAYLMEENSLMMQSLVIAHASFGHNHFYKNNYLFKQWTSPDAIIDYLIFAKRYIRDCEDRYGISEVEAVLDAAHALRFHGIDKYKRPPRLSVAQEENLRNEREAYNQSQVNAIWSTIPSKKKKTEKHEDEEHFPKEPQENLLYFIEKNAPRLEVWQREIIRIVRKIAQYFYPQYQTKVMNEGCATFFHYKLIHDLYDKGMVDDGAMIEFFDSHTAVVRQLDYDHPYYSGFNPYALGLAIYNDIERISMNPTDEDKEWFRGQDWVGNGDWLKNIKWVIENFKDESFIQQFLSPKVIRDLKMFTYVDDDRDPELEVSGIHNQRGYKTVRAALSKQHNIGYHMIPDIQVVNVDRWGSRTIFLKHTMVDRVPLDPTAATNTLRHLCWLWGYPAQLQSVDENGIVKYECKQEGDDKTQVDIFLDDG